MIAKNNEIREYFATTPKGLELLLVDELRQLGATTAAEKLAGVKFTGDLQVGYQACLWSRLANRILLNIATFAVKDPEELYRAVQSIDWSDHFSVDQTFAIHFTATHSFITHTLFGAQKVKDAVVDQFRERTGSRPTVAKDKPDVLIAVHLLRETVAIYIDLSGESLHRRGFRLDTGSAPLKENLAAALLMRAGWQAISDQGGALLDPLCGSGTLLIEAALMAGNIAPGLKRSYFGCLGWKQHDAKLWQSIVTKAKQDAEQGLAKLPKLVGYDKNPEAVKVAFQNIERAGLTGKVHVEKRDLEDLVKPAYLESGLLITNPPYGERLGEIETLKPLYHLLGDKLKQEFPGWHAAIFTGNPELGKEMGLRATRFYALYNGPIACKLLIFDITTTYFVDKSPEAENERRIRQAQREMTGSDTEAVTMLVNRLKKNIKHERKLAKRQGKTAYRIYDADLPDYRYAIDILNEAAFIYEYPVSLTANTKKIALRRQQLLAVIAEVTEIIPRRIYFTSDSEQLNEMQESYRKQ